MQVTCSTAIVRPPGRSYAQGLTSSRQLGPPDLAMALRQHEHYCQALRECGLRLVTLPADERYPDSTFVEDTAVVTARVAVITRPGAASRAGEVQAIATALGALRPQLEYIEAPGTLDGGDVCQAGEHFFIGLSARTNPEGARQLAGMLAARGYTSSTIDIRSCPSLLHLKSGLAWLGDRRCVVVPGLPRTTELADFDCIEVDETETYGANCVRINDQLFMAAGHARLGATLRALGLRLRELEMSEFRKMDGGLSCLSLRF